MMGGIFRQLDKNLHHGMMMSNDNFPPWLGLLCSATDSLGQGSGLPDHHYHYDEVMMVVIMARCQI